MNTKLKAFLIGVVVSYFVGIFGESQFAQIEDRYDFARWGGHTVSNYSRLLSSVDLTRLNLPTNEMSVYSRIDMEANAVRLFVFDVHRDDTILRIDAD